MGCGQSSSTTAASARPAFNQLEGIGIFAGLYRLRGEKVPDGAFMGVSVAYEYTDNSLMPIIPLVTINWSLDGIHLKQTIEGWLFGDSWNETTKTLTIDDTLIKGGAKLHFKCFDAKNGRYSPWCTSFEGNIGSLGHVIGENPLLPQNMSGWYGIYRTSDSNAKPQCTLAIDNNGYSKFTIDNGNGDIKRIDMLPLTVVLNLYYGSQGYSFAYGASYQYGKIMQFSGNKEYSGQQLSQFTSSDVVGTSIDEKKDNIDDNNENNEDGLLGVRRWMHGSSMKRSTTRKEELMELASRKALIREAIESAEDDSIAISKVVGFDCNFNNNDEKEKELANINDKKMWKLAEYAGFYVLTGHGDKNAYVCVYTTINSECIKLTNGASLDQHNLEITLSICDTGNVNDLTIINASQFNAEWIEIEDSGKQDITCTLNIPQNILKKEEKGGAILTFTHADTKNGVVNTMAGTIYGLGVYGASMVNSIPLSYYIGEYRLPEDSKKDNKKEDEKVDNDKIIMKIEASNNKSGQMNDNINDIGSILYDFGNGLQAVKNFIYVPDMYVIIFDYGEMNYFGALTGIGLSAENIGGWGCAMTQTDKQTRKATPFLLATHISN